MRLLLLTLALVLLVPSAAWAADFGTCVGGDDGGDPCAQNADCTGTGGLCKVTGNMATRYLEIVPDSTPDTIDAATVYGPFVIPNGAWGVICSTDVGASTSPSTTMRIEGWANGGVDGASGFYLLDTVAVMSGSNPLVNQTNMFGMMPSGGAGGGFAEMVNNPLTTVWRINITHSSGSYVIESLDCEYIFH